MSQLFTTSPRGDTIATLSLSTLYKLVHDRVRYASLNYPSVDADAVTQNFCVEVEKAMGIFPNVPESISKD